MFTSSCSVQLQYPSCLESAYRISDQKNCCCFSCGLIFFKVHPLSAVVLVVFARTLGDGERVILNPHCIREEEVFDTSRNTIFVSQSAQRICNSVEETSSWEISKI